MRKIFTILFLLINTTIFAQSWNNGISLPGTVTPLQTPNNPSWYVNKVDTFVWLKAGSLGNFKLVDYQKLLKYKLSSDSIFNNGYTSRLKLKHTVDSIIGLIPDTSVFKLKSDTINVEGYVPVNRMTKQLVAKQDTLSIFKQYFINGVTTYSLPFTLKSKALIFVNGSILNDNLYSGVGTSNLTLYIDPKQYDYLKILN
jgi:hypothetical protein